jgi:hypothetical protein
MISDHATSRNRWVIHINSERFYLSFRWLLLGIFLIPFFIKDSPLLETNGDQFILLSFVSLISCAVLLTRLNRPLRQTLWVWIILFILLSGYYLKTFYFVHNFSQLALYLPEWQRLNLGNLINAYPWIVLAFVTFCFVSWFILGLYKKSNIAPEIIQRSVQPAFISIQSMFLVWLFAFGTSTLINLYVMKNYVLFLQKGNILPAHLETLIFFLQNYLIPGVLLLTVWLTWRKKRIWRFLAIGFLLLHFILWGIAYASRGALINFALYIGILWLVTNRFTKKQALVLATLVVVTILVVYPLMSILRAVRIEFGDSPAATWQKTVQVFRRLDLVKTSQYYAVSLLWRVTGVDGVWFSEDHLGEYSILRLVSDPRRESIYRYFSDQAVELLNPLETRPPGLVAAGMLLGGVPGVVFLWIGSIIFLWMLWRWVSRFRTYPVLIAQCGVYIWIFVMGGMLEYRHFIFFFSTTIFCEFLYRVLLRPSRSTQLVRLEKSV